MEIRTFGTISGREIHLYTMRNRAGTSLSVTDAGAAVVSLVYRGVDIVLGWPEGETYGRNPGSLGATVGRHANRIGKARFMLNGQAVELARNNGENNLHSGPSSYSKRVWECAEIRDSAITFLMDSPDGDQGFPGHLKLFTSYELGEDDTVYLRYWGTPDSDTVINPTNHTYFNLNGQGSGSAEGHLLCLRAECFTPTDAGQIPTGEIRPVEGTAFDFRAMHAIGRDIGAEDPQLRISGGYDHNFCLTGEGLREAAHLQGDRTGITLTVLTDCPGVQLYTANGLHGENGKNGAVYSPRAAVCLETQVWPDAVNHPNFPSPVVRAGEEFSSETAWQLSVELPVA